MNLGKVRTFRFGDLLEYLISFVKNNVLGYTQLIIFEAPISARKINALMRVVVKPASMNDIQNICAGATLRKVCKRKLAKRLRNGHMCFIAEDEKGQIAGYCWAAFHEFFVGEISRKIELSHDEVWLYDGFVFPEFRNKKVYQKMMNEAFRFLGKKQFLKVIGTAPFENIASIRGIRRVGGKPKKVVTLLRVFGLKKHSEHIVNV